MELILPSLYILTKTSEIGRFPGVAYKLDDGKVKNELLWGHNKFLSVQMVGQTNEEGLFCIYHIFVERYIDKCLKKPFNNMEIFQFYLFRGDFPEQPPEMRGELVRHFLDEKNQHVWTSYEHLSGLYLANPQYITSQFTASQLEDISPTITEPLIIDKAAYMRNPQNILIPGVILEADQVSTDQRYLEELLFKTRQPKKTWIQ